MTSLGSLAFELQHRWLRLLEQDAVSSVDGIAGQQEQPLSQSDPEFEREQRRAGQLVDELDHALRDKNWPLPTIANDINAASGAYVYGLVPRRAPMRKIAGGFLEPVRYRPLVERVPERVALFLRIMLPGGDDGLEREKHGGVKWHFHYIDDKYRRSDVILSFDTRWTMTIGARGLNTLRPLFVERHAEGKAKFTARPEQWRTEKRTSMYEICSRDLHLGVEHFRCAKNDSIAVWPDTAILTPHPSTLAKAGPLRGGAKRKYKRP